ncbi:hypothetical protein [Nocardia sp. NPDC057455]|uniref:hypothetical protein n=1 Tax=Nocardia sp. NPDC057455 TaxID=3346138 RepID=UPI0036731E15
MIAKFVFVQMRRHPVLTCWCVYCDSEWRRVVTELDPDARELQRFHMIVCPVCGNKRCPRATYHEHDCTRSNESGQEGSVYGGFIWEGRT